MRIKRLEIYGFKSFPQKAVLPFPPGISAIVGPNGAGKSNVLDALRWVLGEQNPRRLRVREMADVIFCGDNGRGPSFAEVRLVLDNEDGIAPKELQNLPEIVITRRLYRQGESEYLLNNRPCRLKDIVYLFLDTGAHPRAYGLIDQGQVGQFVEQSPKERRGFLEELAGVARYKMRREETTRQLARTRENLVRLKDILVEVEAREAELERQAEEARAYLELQERLREVEIARLARLFAVSERKREKIAQSLSREREHLEGLLLREREIVPEYEELAGRIELLRQEITQEEEAYHEVETRVQALSKEMAALLKKEAEFSRQKERLEAEVSHRKERIAALRQQLKELRKEGEGLDERFSSLDKVLAEFKEKIRGLSRERRELEAALSECQRSLSRLRGEKGRIRERLAAVEAAAERLASRRKKAERELAALAQQERELLSFEEDTKRTLKELSDRKETLSARLEEGERAFKAAEEESRRLKEEKNELLLRLKELSHEQGLLRRFLEREALPEALHRLRKAGFSVRPLAEALTLSPEQERLAEWALGETLTAALATSREEALKMAAFLKEKALAGEILWLREDPQAFVERRLSGVVESEDLPSALDSGQQAFTPEGFSVTPEGLISFRPGRREPGLLQRRRRLRELEEAEARARERERELARQAEALRRRLQELREQNKKNKEELSQVTRELESYFRRLAEIELKEKHLAEKRSFFREELSKVGEEGADLKRQRETLKQELDRLCHREEALKQEEETLLGRLSALKKELRGLFEEERSVELELSALRERVRQRRAEEERLLKEEASFSRDLARLKEDLLSTQTELEALKGRLSRQREELRRAEVEVASRRETLTHKREELRGLEIRFEGVRHEREGLRRQIDRLKERLHRREVDLAEAELTSNHLREQAQETYRVDLREVSPGEMDLGKLEAERETLRERLRGYQAVNLAAIEELEKVRERRRFLLEQREDLEKAIADLEQAVRRINQTCRERLREALNLANEKLAQIFPLLFPGGTARLKFVASDDPLEAGLDLEVKLPGKPIRHLAMLSGGEKALTALAVLCAFYLVKPGPFCVLDEVDAPLDEANTERFLALLKEISRYSQVILVTHNRRVMEAAEALFGITMEEKGVSKVVSVQLTDQLESRP